MKRLVLISCILFAAAISAHARQKDFLKVSGTYLGQKPPGTSPEVFAPGIISTYFNEGCSGWGNNMEYFIFQRWIDGKSYLYSTRQVNSTWSEPELLTCVEQYQIGDFTIAPDGKTLVFASNILIEEIGSEGEGGNIWMMEKTDTGWTEPKQIGRPVNTEYHESYPSMAANKTLCFFSRKPGGFGQSDLYYSKFNNGKYVDPVNLGDKLNTEYHEWDPYIAPDESYMIFCSMMPGGLGEDDLYITYKQKDRTWGKPIHLGNEINSEKSENRPYVTPDGKYFFYTSNKNGNRDIYWVSSKLFDLFIK